MLGRSAALPPLTTSNRTKARYFMLAIIDYSVIQNVGWMAFYLFLIYVLFRLAVGFFGRVRNKPEE